MKSACKAVEMKYPQLLKVSKINNLLKNKTAIYQIYNLTRGVLNVVFIRGDLKEDKQEKLNVLLGTSVILKHFLLQLSYNVITSQVKKA